MRQRSGKPSSGLGPLAACACAAQPHSQPQPAEITPTLCLPAAEQTGRAYGERPPLTIAPHIYPELEAFMSTWRAHLQPRHALLFSQRNGEPLTDKSLYKLFWTTAYRLTGRKTNPHLVRDSIVTYLRGGGATERELEVRAAWLALLARVPCWVLKGEAAMQCRHRLKRRKVKLECIL